MGDSSRPAKSCLEIVLLSRCGARWSLAICRLLKGIVRGVDVGRVAILGVALTEFFVVRR